MVVKLSLHSNETQNICMNKFVNNKRMEVLQKKFNSHIGKSENRSKISISCFTKDIYIEKKTTKLEKTTLKFLLLKVSCKTIFR